MYLLGSGTAALTAAFATAISLAMPSPVSSTAAVSAANPPHASTTTNTVKATDVTATTITYPPDIPAVVPAVPSWHAKPICNKDSCLWQLVAIDVRGRARSRRDRRRECMCVRKLCSAPFNTDLLL